MKCQIVCPYNKPFTDYIEDTAEFTTEETRVLLQDLPAEELLPSIIEKINLMDLQDYIKVIPRNLSVLLKKEKL